jgi:hypothetical protein
LAAGNVIRSENFLIAHDRIHHGGDVLPAGIGMTQAKGVAHLVKKNAADIRNRGAVRHELQRAAVGIEARGPVKKRVGFDHGPA